MTAHGELVNRIRLALSRGDTRLFLNPVGEAWTGDAVRTQDGSVLIRHPRRVRYGLYAGSGDLVGWTTLNGRAVLTVIEAKTGGGVPSREQKDFIAAVLRAGGIAGIARSVEDAQRIIAAGMWGRRE